METGKEIYKEYVIKYWTECNGESQRVRLNKKYSSKKSGKTITAINNDKRVCASQFLELDYDDLAYFKRTPKTQMINGHEVVAPRYDMPEAGQRIYIYYPLYEDGVLATSYLAEYIKHGWFDNEKDALAYAKAHRESN